MTEIINFKAKDGMFLDGFINKCGNETKKILIQVHGMTSNCFTSRNRIIAKELENIKVDVLSFNNRGSDLAKYIKSDTKRIIGGTTFENIKDCYYDIVGAIECVLNLGYEEIYLQGHSLGSTKVVYTYNKLKEEKNPIIKNIKAVVLLSLVDIAGVVRFGTSEKYIRFAIKKEKKNETIDIMPLESFIHPVSVKTFLQYTRDNKDFDFARYDYPDDKFKILNDIQAPLFMRWGNVNEMIKQDAKDLVEFMNTKINNPNKDIGYIDGADHNYHGKEEELAKQIKDFLK